MKKVTKKYLESRITLKRLCDMIDIDKNSYERIVIFGEDERDDVLYISSEIIKSIGNRLVESIEATIIGSDDAVIGVWLLDEELEIID